MATGNAENSTAPNKPSEEEEEHEAKLLAYLQSVLKYQIIAMDFMDLRGLVKEAPQHLKLYPYLQDKYPGQEFILFLQKYPDVFVLNPDNTVQVKDSAFCVQQPPSKGAVAPSYDEVDAVGGRDRGEYESDYDSDD